MPNKELPKAAKEVKVIGPYSPVVQIGDHYHFSGIIPPLDEYLAPVTKDRLVQMRQVLAKMLELLSACGLTANEVYSVQVMLLLTMEGYSEFNRMYAEVMRDVDVLPRRTVFAVADLPRGVHIELTVDAVRQRNSRDRYRNQPALEDFGSFE